MTSKDGVKILFLADHYQNPVKTITVNSFWDDKRVKPWEWRKRGNWCEWYFFQSNNYDGKAFEVITKKLQLEAALIKILRGWRWWLHSWWWSWGGWEKMIQDRHEFNNEETGWWYGESGKAVPGNTIIIIPVLRYENETRLTTKTSVLTLTFMVSVSSRFSFFSVMDINVSNMSIGT